MPIEKLAIDNKYPSDVYLGIESVKYIYKDTKLVYSKKIKVRLYLDQGISSVTYTITEKDGSKFSKTVFGSTVDASSFYETVGYGAIIEFEYSVADGYTVVGHPLTTSVDCERNFFFTTKLVYVSISMEDNIESIAWVNVPKNFTLYTHPNVFDDGIGAYSKGVYTSGSEPVLVLPTDSLLLFKLIGYNDKVYTHGVVSGLDYDYYKKVYTSGVLTDTESAYAFDFSLRRLCAINLYSYSPADYTPDAPGSYAMFQVCARECSNDGTVIYASQASDNLIVTEFIYRSYTFFAPFGSALYIYDYNTTSGFTLSSIEVNDKDNIKIGSPPYYKQLLEADAKRNGYYSSENGVYYDSFSVWFNFKKSS